MKGTYIFSSVEVVISADIMVGLPKDESLEFEIQWKNEECKR